METNRQHEMTTLEGVNAWVNSRGQVILELKDVETSVRLWRREAAQLNRWLTAVLAIKGLVSS